MRMSYNLNETKVGMSRQQQQTQTSDLKHKDINNGGSEERTRSKALFSPSPHGDSEGSRVYSAHDAEAEAMSSEYDTEPNTSTPVASRTTQYKTAFLSKPGENVEQSKGDEKKDEKENGAQKSGGEKTEEEGGQGGDDDDDDGIFNPYQFIAGLPTIESIDRNEVTLPPAQGRKPTLVLDLDETLVHCTVEPIEKPDMKFPVTFNGILYDVYVRKRPYLDYFFEAVCRTFEVVVFTASQKVYADVLLDLLDPENKYIKHRLFRESCVLVQGNYLKDLHVCGRNYKTMVLVDNSPHAYGFQIENGIPIESWFDDDTDTELLKLVGFLRKAFAGNDVRPVIREHFKTHQLIEKAIKGQWVDCQSPPPL